MALAASGTLSLSQIRTEFGGGSGAISLSNLYRGGSRVRSKAGNNTAVNLAANVPTSGAIDFADFHSQARAFRKTYSSGATNQDASSIFGDDYGVDYPKEIVIDSGVELGATSTSQEALQIDSGLSGSMTITNNGTLSGAGGAANGGAGGDAFEANVTCTFINNGTVRAGGGGGGQGGAGGAGGTGGQGRTSYTYYGSYGSWNYDLYINASSFVVHAANTTTQWRYQGTTLYNNNYGHGPWGTTRDHGSYRYQREGNSGYQASGYTGAVNVGSHYNPAYNVYYRIRRASQLTGYNYFNGGAGGSGGSAGSGGVGQGYNQSAGSGSSGSSGSGGSAGGTNAGSGGSGGAGGAGAAGGSFGQAGGTGSNGSTGNSGGNGNYTNGSGGSGGASGSGGGAAGKYIRGLSNVTFTNNGTVQGGTA